MRLLCPDLVCRSVLEIDLTQLYDKGIRGILLDLDNTLVRWDRDDLPPEIAEWVARAKAQGFQLCLVSNGLPDRVRRIAQMMDLPWLSKAIKPRRRPFLRALKLLNLDKHQTAMVGDQIFTDVLGANRLGLYTILINPLTDQELRATKVVRKLERRILNRFARRGWVSSEVIRQRNEEGRATKEDE